MSTSATLPAKESESELRQLRHQLADTRAQLAHSQQALNQSQLALAQALRAAHSDALTGLPNRRAFGPLSERTLATHQAGARLLALLYVDLDGFKAVNDRLGHGVGDALLRVVSARLAHGVRRGDLVCRQGGDEFICLLPYLIHAARAQAVAEKLVRAISAPCQIGPHRVAVSASIGIALYPRHGASVAALLESADAAMYRAKAHRSGVATALGSCGSAQSSGTAAGTFGASAAPNMFVAAD